MKALREELEKLRLHGEIEQEEEHERASELQRQAASTYFPLAQMTQPVQLSQAVWSFAPTVALMTTAGGSAIAGDSLGPIYAPFPAVERRLGAQTSISLTCLLIPPTIQSN